MTALTLEQIVTGFTWLAVIYGVGAVVVMLWLMGRK